MESFDFLNEQNACGQTILRLVARGNAIIAELLRLSANVPPCFFHDLTAQNMPATKSTGKKEKGNKKASQTPPQLVAPLHILIPQSELRYKKILFDFDYLEHQEYYDNLIDSDPDVVDMDEEFRENHMDLLERFFLLFESIWKYVSDFVNFVEQVQDGVFIQHTMEIILQNVDGKQLMIEALYLLGVILYLLDLKIEGVVRERLVVCYIRYKGSQEIENMEDVCNLVQQTGYSQVLGKRPETYPVDYFGRFKLPRDVISMIIGRLRSDDIYGLISTYPLPEHRSVALSSQAAMLFIILFFAPEILHNQSAVMREIVDKHFSDNWIISFYMGYTADLNFAWVNFRAAFAALNNTIELQNVKDLQQTFMDRFPDLRKTLVKYLTEGVLTRQYVLDNINRLLSAERDFNVTVRWFMLHMTSKNKRLREIVYAGVDPEVVLMFLLDVSQFEYRLKQHLTELVDTKEEKWESDKQLGADRMQELSEFFSGEKMLTRVEKDEGLQKYFAEIADEILGLDFSDSTLAGRKISKLMEGLEEVESFHQIESNVHIKHFLADTRHFLSQMIKAVNVSEEMLIKLSTISDLSYATQLINGYTTLIQKRISHKAATVIKLRAVFLKLASVLSQPLVRISQSNSPDLMSVSNYYSGEIVNYVRKVLEIIPQSMFLHLDEIISIQTNDIKELPTRVEKALLKEVAQLPQRASLARATHSVSVFTQGILAMETTLVGVIKVEPKQLLEDGIRKQLVHKISSSLHEKINFKAVKGEGGFEDKLGELARTLDGFRRSFEYISDYINIYGLRIWQEEFTRIIGYNVEQECNSFLKKKIYDWSSEYQSETIPIPKFPPVDAESVTFIGRLARQLLAQSSPKRAVFCEQLNGWVDPKTGKELVGLRTFSLLHTAVGTQGLSGLDRLISFMIVKELQVFVRMYRKEITRELAGLLGQLNNELNPTSVIHPNLMKIYKIALTKMSKVWNLFQELCISIGHKQLIRKMINNELNFSSKLDSTLLTNALQVLNSSILIDVQQHYANPELKPYPGDDSNPILVQLAKYLDNTGITDPLLKIYITTEPLSGFALFVFLFVISQVPKFEWDNTLGAMVQKAQKKEILDGAPFCAGVITLLKQFHASNTTQFLSFIGQYVRASTNGGAGSGGSGGKDSKKDGASGGPPSDVVSLVWFLEQYCRFSQTPTEHIEARIPPYVFESKTVAPGAGVSQG